MPPAPPDDLLHAVLVRSRDPVPEDEDEDELEVVAEIHHQTEPAVREPPSQGRFHRSDPQTWHWALNFDLLLLAMFMFTFIREIYPERVWLDVPTRT